VGRAGDIGYALRVRRAARDTLLNLRIGGKCPTRGESRIDDRGELHFGIAQNPDLIRSASDAPTVAVKRSNRQRRRTKGGELPPPRRSGGTGRKEMCFIHTSHRSSGMPPNRAFTTTSPKTHSHDAGPRRPAPRRLDSERSKNIDSLVGVVEDGLFGTLPLASAIGQPSTLSKPPRGIAPSPRWRFAGERGASCAHAGPLPPRLLARVRRSRASRIASKVRSSSFVVIRTEYRPKHGVTVY